MSRSYDCEDYKKCRCSSCERKYEKCICHFCEDYKRHKRCHSCKHKYKSSTIYKDDNSSSDTSSEKESIKCQQPKNDPPKCEKPKNDPPKCEVYNNEKSCDKYGKYVVITINSFDSTQEFYYYPKQKSASMV